MTPADDDALAVVRADKRFLQLPVADRDRVLAGALETKRRHPKARGRRIATAIALRACAITRR